ncbi:MAG: GNAT family N-acetyltransferase [Thermoplasmata archaeon]
MIRLEPMSPEQLEEWLPGSIQRYADGHVQNGGWDPADALENSKNEHTKLLPNGVDTPDHYLRILLDASSGSRVGEVWYMLQHDGKLTRIWIYWIGIDEKFRRHGYAEATLHRLDEEAQRLGADRVALHVFGDNNAARSLYSKLGYETTNVVMTKKLPS